MILQVGTKSPPQTHTIHGTGIFTYSWLMFMVNAGKYTSPMDAMGNHPPPKKKGNNKFHKLGFGILVGGFNPSEKY